MDLDLGIISESEKRLKKKLILDYIYTNLKHHNFWAYRYFFCEFLALINVVGKILLSITIILINLYNNDNNIDVLQARNKVVMRLCRYCKWCEA